MAFLSSGCLTCRTFWDGLRPEVRRPLPDEARLVVVVKDREFESPSKLLELAPADVLVVHSSEAWEDYGITMSPYFCFVDGADGDGALRGGRDVLGPGAVVADRRDRRRGARAAGGRDANAMTER